MNTVLTTPTTATPNWLKQDLEAKPRQLVKTYAAMAVTAAMVITQVPGLVQNWLEDDVSTKAVTEGQKYLQATNGYDLDVRHSDSFSAKLSPEIKDWIVRSPLGFTALDHLVSTIQSVFGDVAISASTHIDTDEGWEKLILSVDSGIDDYAVVMNQEDMLFAKIDADPVLLNALKSVVISQV